LITYGLKHHGEKETLQVKKVTYAETKGNTFLEQARENNGADSNSNCIFDLRVGR